MSQNSCTGISLYRYDIECPPSEWSTNFKSSFYNFPDLGFKNKVGAFFFFDNLQETVSYASNKLSECEQIVIEKDPRKTIWITRTQISQSVNLLDFRKIKDVCSLYIFLIKSGIDIFIDEFRKTEFCMPSVPYATIKEAVFDLSNHINIEENRYKIMNFSYGNNEFEKLKYAFQQLTDFSNGIIFKNILTEKGFDGYIFKESEANTYCIFDSFNLGSRCCKQLEFEEWQRILK